MSFMTTPRNNENWGLEAGGWGLEVGGGTKSSLQPQPPASSPQPLVF